MTIRNSLLYALISLLPVGPMAKASSAPTQQQAIRAVPAEPVEARAATTSASDAKDPDHIEMTDQFGRTHRVPSSEMEEREMRELKDRYDLTAFEEFAVSKAFLFGKPFRQARKYHGEDYSRLLEFLRDPAWQESWSNIVTTIGVICDEPAADHLIAFAREQRPTQTTREHFLLESAKRGTYTALGYCIARTDSEKALSFLQSGLKPKRNESAIQSAHGDGPYASFRFDATAESVRGLALAGTERSIEILEGHRQQLTRRAKDAQAGEAVHKEVDAVLDSLLHARRVQDEGLEGYYSR